MENEYNFKKIEKKWQEQWANSDYGKAKDDDSKPKHYHLVEFPILRVQAFTLATVWAMALQMPIQG